jgi:hypothetical protein
MTAAALIGIITGIIGAGASAAGAAASIAQGERAFELMKEGGELSKAASYANASDAERIGALNAGAITKAAYNNALATRDVGYSNAKAIASSSLHNLGMYQIQSDEDQRLHRLEERWHAGEIRAMMSGTGVQVNTGSPLAYLRSEITKGIQERQFMLTRDQWTMVGMGADDLKKTLLTVKTANWNAKVTEENAKLQAGVVMAAAVAEAAAMRRQGDIAAAVGVANAQAARAQGNMAAIGAISNAVGYAGDAYSSWKASQTPAFNYTRSVPSYRSAGRSYSPPNSVNPGGYWNSGQIGF